MREGKGGDRKGGEWRGGDENLPLHAP